MCDFCGTVMRNGNVEVCFLRTLSLYHGHDSAFFEYFFLHGGCVSVAMKLETMLGGFGFVDLG